MGLLSRRTGAALLFVAIALVSTASAGVNTPQSGWYSGNPLLGPNSLTDLACAGSTCYAAGDFGTLLKSKDSGATWTGIVTGLTLDLGRVTLAGGDANRVVVGGGCAVRRSDDGGGTFFRLPFTARDTGCAQGAVSFAFPTENTGYLLLASGQVLATTDGGHTFARRTAVPGQANDILCTAERTCVTAGPSGRIERTTDGGVSWTLVGNANAGLLEITQADPLTLYAVGFYRTVMKSIDGGSSWIRKTDQNPSSNLRRIACGDALHCLITTEGTQVLRTFDGGDTFSTVAPSSDPTYAVGFAGPAQALAAGTLGSAETSNDAGDTWSAVGTRVAGTFGVLSASTGSIAYAGGAVGVLARTADGGQTWSNVSPPTEATVTGLAAAGPSRLYVLAGDGTLQRSDNAGQSYSLLNTGTLRPLGIAAIDGDRLLLLGAGLSRSDDGGETFEAASGSIARTRLSSADIAGGAVFAYGDLALFASTDRAVHWTRVPKPKGRAIVDVDFATRRLGYLLDTRGTLWKTTNGGLRWAQVQSLGAAGRAVEFSSASAGYVVIRGFGGLRDAGVVLRTTDGGRTWHPQLVSRFSLIHLESSGTVDYALAGNSALYGTTVGGDIGSRSTLTLSSRPRSLKRPGSVTLGGRLSSADGGEEIVVSQLVNGRWSRKLATAASNGTFTTRWRINRSAVFVAQVLGDADHRGAGTRAITVRVR